MSEDKNKNLPTLADLTNDLDNYKKQDQLNVLLNHEPPAKWIKQHPLYKKEILNDKGQLVKVPIDYLPIDKIEHLLRKIFKAFKIEVLTVQQLFNSVQVTIRLWYIDPISGEWRYHDGVGASPIQMDKGAGRNDLSAIKNNAVMIATPIAKSYAVKDAADMFGRLFGSDLNRDAAIQYTQDLTLETDEDIRAEIIKLQEREDYATKVSEEDKMHIENILETKHALSYRKVYTKLKKLLE